MREDSFVASASVRPEPSDAEAFIQAAVDSAPEPLRRLGEWLAGVLDEDDWPTAERLLLGAAIASGGPAPADTTAATFDPRNSFEMWAGDDNRDLAAEMYEEREPDNFLFYATDGTNQAYIGWYFALKHAGSRPKLADATPTPNPPHSTSGER